ncbi:hypothetical protein GN244_ATG02818 [Phytophthora infestans]|uniref:Ankyrin repeat protein n=1 Tax=Phytophthora infestans TaxID=4787 RepID=A0A833X0X1_PHYIN|nr:hypothetical protein GN244_ATG02818 [Phytophthora infestans]
MLSSVSTCFPCRPKTRRRCSRALVNAVGGGHLQTVKTLLGQWDDFFDGDRSALENAFTVPKPCYKFDILKALELAVKNKNAEVVRVICDESGVRGEIMKWAAEHGYLDVLQVVYRFEEDFVEDLYRAMIIAVERGFLEIVKFLTTECGEGLIAFAADEFGFCCPVISAIEHGNIEVMEYLETQNMFLDETFVPVFCAAAAHGPLDVVRTFYEREELDDTALDGAFASAAGKSQLEILTYLQTKRKFDHVAINEALNAAANNGHLDAVKYLCGIEDYEISAAALDAAFECAAEVWHLEMVKFLDGKGKVSRASVNTAFVNAMNEPNCYRGEIDDQLEIFKFLYSKGCIYTDIIQDDFVDFARSCHVDVVEFVYSKISTSISCKMVEKAFKKATCENSTEVVKFLYGTGVVSPKPNFYWTKLALLEFYCF